MDINELVGVWPRIFGLKKMGELRKQDVLEALRSGEPVPPKAALLLADIMDRTYKFKTGKKPKEYLVKHAAYLSFEFLKMDLEAGDLDGIYDQEDRKCAQRDLAAGETPHTVALELTAKDFGISTRQLETYISECRSFGRQRLR